MADLFWVYAEVVDGKIARAALELLSKAAELGHAEAILLGPAPDDGVATLSAHGASKVYRSTDPFPELIRIESWRLATQLEWLCLLTGVEYKPL